MTIVSGKWAGDFASRLKRAGVQVPIKVCEDYHRIYLSTEANRDLGTGLSSTKFY